MSGGKESSTNCSWFCKNKNIVIIDTSDDNTAMIINRLSYVFFFPLHEDNYAVKRITFRITEF